MRLPLPVLLVLAFVYPAMPAERSIIAEHHQTHAGVFRSTTPVAENGGRVDSVATLISVAPETGAPGASVFLMITGESTLFSSGPFEVERVWLEKGSLRIEGTSIQILGNTRLQARFAIPSTPEYIGTYSVSVEQPRGVGIVTMTEGFTVTGTSGVESVDHQSRSAVPSIR
jgi:hypothetical protein